MIIGNIAKPLGLRKRPNPGFHVVKELGFLKTGVFTVFGPKPRDVPPLARGGHKDCNAQGGGVPPSLQPLYPPPITSFCGGAGRPLYPGTPPSLYGHPRAAGP